ncbi:hypothetical protein V6N11_076863 [Hibiscus sabdariffa]|uniref:Uncharacterized protein n=1 Tax=Hibiscus sabdariffa TaxID=183260 RepID=A0ABR2TBT9_9ROSI
MCLEPRLGVWSSSALHHLDWKGRFWIRFSQLVFCPSCEWRCLVCCVRSRRRSLEWGLVTVLELQLVPSSWFAWQLSSLVPPPAVELGRLGCGVPLAIASQKYHSHRRIIDELLRYCQLL